MNKYVITYKYMSQPKADHQSCCPYIEMMEVYAGSTREAYAIFQTKIGENINIVMCISIVKVDWED